MEDNFIDQIRVFFRSGKGGAGSAHLHRAKFQPKGGPDGGDGGRGGHIILKGNRNLWTLLHLRYTKHLFAGDGQPGGSSLKTGADGKDVVVEVPLGTVAIDEESGRMECEVTEHDQTVILIKGGRGGLGNNHFKSATNRTPRYAQPGEPSLEGWKTLELKLLADVGLVGFPNAGKSTLLSVVSAAKPKIGAYPFTTLRPNLGIVEYRDFQSFVMADIPGIIEGAHEGKGLGTRFLRHIERNSVLLFMVPADAEDHLKEYNILLNELTLHNPDLLHKTRIVALSKCDLVDDKERDDILEKFPESLQVIGISSVTGSGIQELKDLLWRNLTSYVF